MKYFSLVLAIQNRLDEVSPPPEMTIFPLPLLLTDRKTPQHSLVIAYSFLPVAEDHGFCCMCKWQIHFHC